MNDWEILARQLIERGIGDGRYANAFTTRDRPGCRPGPGRPPAPAPLARRAPGPGRPVNPFLKTIEAAGFQSYWWVLDQAELPPT